MDAIKRSTVIEFCIFLHNYYVCIVMELETLLRFENGVLEVAPGLRVLAPPVAPHGTPSENLNQGYLFAF